MNKAGPLPLRSLWSDERLMLHNISPLLIFLKLCSATRTMCHGRREGVTEKQLTGPQESYIFLIRTVLPKVLKN